jgi:hypothetical protein
MNHRARIAKIEAAETSRRREVEPAEPLSDEELAERLSEWLDEDGRPRADLDPCLREYGAKIAELLAIGEARARRAAGRPAR